MNENELSYEIIGAAIEVHKELGGPSLLEDMYEEALYDELQARGLRVRRQVGFVVKYKGRELKKRLVIDVLRRARNCENQICRDIPLHFCGTIADLP